MQSVESLTFPWIIVDCFYTSGNMPNGASSQSGTEGFSAIIGKCRNGGANIGQGKSSKAGREMGYTEERETVRLLRLPSFRRL
jgi:hypothetical protein